MVDRFREVLNQRKGQKQSLDKSLKTREEDLKTQLDKLLDLEESRLIVQSVTEDAQNTLAETLNTIVSDALATVWDEEYSFKIKIESKANTVIATPVIIKDGEEYSPKSDSGYGVVQVASFAIRIALLSLQKDSTGILLLDEPFKDIDKIHMPLACELLHTISEKMDIEIICVTHEPTIKEVADKLFNVTLKNGVSHVEVV